MYNLAHSSVESSSPLIHTASGDAPSGRPWLRSLLQIDDLGGSAACKGDLELRRSLEKQCAGSRGQWEVPVQACQKISEAPRLPVSVKEHLDLVTGVAWRTEGDGNEPVHANMQLK